MTTESKNTPADRQAEFKRLYASIPARSNLDRIRRVCEVLHIQPNTVRIYCMKQPPRTIPERSLKILRAALTA